jgi:hypothetical protein
LPKQFLYTPVNKTDGVAADRRLNAGVGRRCTMYHTPAPNS